MKNVNVAVVGGLRAGKSSLVEKLQQRKGMESDICFHSYKQQDANVTLVDIPGDLQKMGPLMNAVGLSDAALLAVPADKGIDVQTGEAVIALTLAGITRGAVAITKTDMATPDDIEALKGRIRGTFRGTPVEKFPILETSTLTRMGIPELMQALADIEVPRSGDGPFKLYADHTIEPKSGFTVVTGVVQRGTVKVKDKVKALPWDKELVVQSLQIHNEEVKESIQGDRLALGFKGIHYHDIVRGDVLTSEDSPLAKTKTFPVEFTVERFYKEPVAPDQRLHAAIGLQFYPVLVKGLAKNGAPAAEARAGETCTLQLESERMNFTVEEGETCILVRPELPPRVSRICGSGKITLP